MEPQRLLLIFEHSSEEARLTGVDETLRALGQNNIDVTAVTRNSGEDGLITRVLRFWFPYLWNAGIVGVTPGAAAEIGEFIVTLAPLQGPAFGGVLAAWLQAGHGRKVRVKGDDIEVEARTPEQAQLLLSRLEASRSIGASAIS